RGRRIRRGGTAGVRSWRGLSSDAGSVAHRFRSRAPQERRRDVALKSRRATVLSITGVLSIIGAVLFAAGCPNPRQYEGPIPIDTAGFARRFEFICALGGASAETCAPKREEDLDSGTDASGDANIDDGASRDAPEIADAAAPTAG